MSLEVMYQRCAGIDVHQRFLVVCVSVIEEGKRRKEVRTFNHETADLLALRQWLLEEHCTQGQHGEYGRVLDASLSSAGGFL